IVNLSAAYDQPVVVNYSTADGTATVGDRDYQPKAGRLGFKPGQTTQTNSVPVRGGRKIEPDETFFVNPSGASSNAFVLDSQGVGTIINDDSAPTGRSKELLGDPGDDTAARRLLDPSPSATTLPSRSAFAPARHLSTAGVDLFFAAITPKKSA